MSRRRRQEDIDQSSDEARQVHEGVEDQDQQPQSSEEGEDLIENASQDYRSIKELDMYEGVGIDDEEYEINPEARRKAEKEIQKREDERHEDESLNDYIDEDEEEMRVRGEQRRFYQNADQFELDENEEKDITDAENFKGKVKNWLQKESVKKYIGKYFCKFLQSYKGEYKYAIYAEKFKEMGVENRQSISIDYQDFKSANPTICFWINCEPRYMMTMLNNILYQRACVFFSSYSTAVTDSYVKFKNIPVLDFIRDLRWSHLGRIIRIQGVITVRSQVFSQLKKVMFKCFRCGHIKGPFEINSANQSIFEVGSCESCQSRKSFLIHRHKTLYRNYQKLTIQQSPSEVLPGRIPRTKELIVYGDSVDKVKPGDEVEVVGIYMNKFECNLNATQGFPIFKTIVEVNNIFKVLEEGVNSITEEDEQLFAQWSKDQKLDKKIYGSIAPSIYGHQGVKRALTFSMFGGCPKNNQGHKIRGDINVLLLGDPGIAKSQFLKSIQKVFYRAIYTTGKGATAVGLTASVKKDFETGQFKLEAGALVIADKGICLIDEFDKMNESDRTSIHEAMEQQSISISKAGIVTTLNARCSVIAAANPLQGRYNNQLNFVDNVDLTSPILSRFDILNVIKDECDEEIDHHLSTFVINSHIDSHPFTQKYDIDSRAEKLVVTEVPLPVLELDKLKLYIKYAREKCHPKLAQKHLDMITQFYKKIRQESKEKGGIDITTRHLESIIRISEAHAKIFLRNEVSKEDIQVGIKNMLESFIQTQKLSSAKLIKKKFLSYLDDA